MKGYLLIIGALTVIVSVLISLNIFFQQSLQMEIAEEFNKQQLIISESIAGNIRDYVHLMEEEIKVVTRLLTRLDIQSRSDFDWLAGEILKTKEKINSDFGIIGADGTVKFARTNAQGLVLPSRELVEKAIGGGKDSVTIGDTGQRLYFVSPVYEGGKLKEVIFLSVSAQDIATHFMSQIRSEHKGNTWMMSRNGTLLFHPTQPDMDGRNLYKTDPSCFKCHVSFDLEKKIVEGKVSNYGRYVAPHGEDRIIAFSTVDVGALSWLIFVSAPYSKVIYATEQSMRLYSYLIISILMTTIVVSTALIVFNKKRIQAKEIERRQEAMERYAIELEEKVKERTSQLTDEKEKLNSIVSAIGGGLVLIDRQGKIQWANPMIKDMAGIELTGLSCEDICFDCQITGSYAKDDLETIVVSNLFNQKDKYFQITTAPVKGEDGDLHGYIRLIQDVTEMKKMEEQMSNSEKLASIGRLAAGIAHEIGNPLTSIFSFVQILKEIEHDEFKKESLHTIHFHINRISEILKQLSGFTKMPVGEAKECQVNDVIESSIVLIQYDKKAREIAMNRELDPSLPMVTADKNQLSQVFVNLILNAIDAMPEGGTLTVKSFLRGGDVVVQFQDTGVGIPQEDLIKIFDPFYTTKEKGTGLGLAVSYNIVKKMNGTLTVESQTGRGTIFTITLPVFVKESRHA
ncbi:MAG: ATP-binding protein [Chloroflexota bacterium]